jgi:Uma2 family endonuclease/plasmid maintenance system antidote protein VapI
MGKAAEALRQVLRIHRISQNQLAIALGVERGIVGRWVHERRGLNSDTVVDIVKALHNLYPSAAREFIQLYLGNEIEEEASQATVQPHLWTVNEYHQMMETGILTLEDRVELLEGQIIQMHPQSSTHASTVLHIGAYLQNLLSGQAEVRIQMPITLSTSVPRPDVAIVQVEPSGYSDRHSTCNEVVWLLEVVDAATKIDYEWKARIYARSGIEDYWLVDRNRNQQVCVFREPQDQGYQSKSSCSNGFTLVPLSFPEVEVSLESLLY